MDYSFKRIEQSGEVVLFSRKPFILQTAISFNAECPHRPCQAAIQDSLSFNGLMNGVNSLDQAMHLLMVQWVSSMKHDEKSIFGSSAVVRNPLAQYQRFGFFDSHGITGCAEMLYENP